MFTGIIQTVGTIEKIEKFENDVRFQIKAHADFLSDVKVGDSISINGVCLTVINVNDSLFNVDVSFHTLEKTTLNQFNTGSRVNLEKCLQLNSYMGGHCVLGHVDGVAVLLEKKTIGRSEEWVWKIPSDLLGFIAEKGSLTIDGISLTVNSIKDNKVGITLVPHTLDATALMDINVGEKANIEVDVIARYVARWLSVNNEQFEEKIHEKTV